MKIELIYSPDCPHVDQSRRNLTEALARAGLNAGWVEWNLGDAGVPEDLRGYGSPTILLDGKDIGGELQANCCRLYGGFGAPPAELILRSIGERRSGLFQKSIAGPALGVALLPKLACPACWPAYAALVSSLGLGFLLDGQYLFWLTAFVMVAAVLALGYRAGSRRGFGPLILGLVSGLALLAGKFFWDLTWLSYSGVAGLMAAAVWNAWPRRSPPLTHIQVR